MKKTLITVAIALLASNALELQAFKKVSKTSAPTPKSAVESKLAPVPKPAVEPKTTPVPKAKPRPGAAPVVNREAIVQEVQQEEAKAVLEEMVEALLRHPIIGANKEDAIGAINAFRNVLATVEQDSRLQALPSKAQSLAQLQKAPKRDLTDREKIFLLSAARHKQTADVFGMYMQLRPDVEFDAAFYAKLQEEAQKREFTPADERDVLARAKGWTPGNFWTEFTNYLKRNHLDWDSKVFGRVVEVIETTHGVTIPVL